MFKYAPELESGSSNERITEASIYRTPQTSGVTPYVFFATTRAVKAVKATSNDEMDFSTPPAGAKMGSADKEHLMDQVKQQIALANAQELLQVPLMRSCISHRQLMKSTQSQTWQFIRAEFADRSHIHFGLL